MANTILPEATPVAAVAPCGLNHLVINVREIGRAHV